MTRLVGVLAVSTLGGLPVPSSAQTVVVRRADIERAGWNRVTEILDGAVGWARASVDGSTYAVSPDRLPAAGVSSPSMPEWIVIVNGQRVPTDVFGLHLLELLPISVGQTDSVVFTRGPTIYAGVPVTRGVMSIFSRRRLPGVNGEVTYQHGDESGDPGPYRYTDLALGLISEYLVVIPMALVLSERLGYDALFGTALVTIAAKIGYLTSVTNPLALAIAQPIVGVPVFSGAGFRAVTFVVFLPIGIWYLLKRCRPSAGTASKEPNVAPHDASRLSARQTLVLLVLLGAIATMILGVQRIAWGSAELAAMYIAVAITIAVAGGTNSREASQAFVRGMQGMMLAGLLVGLAAAIEVILRDGMILDSIVAYLTRSIEGKPPVVVANLMMLMQMAIDVFIPSTSGKAAVTMPILGPIGQLAGVSGQVSVQAFLFGNGLMNTLTPTSGMLLAYLATGRISFGRWVRFILPLAAGLFLLCVGALTTAVLIGF